MALTTQTFSEITGCGTNVRTDARGDERRKDLRVPLRVQASIVPLSGRISIGLVVGPDGRVTQTRVEAPRYLIDQGLAGCLRPVLRGMRFPAAGKDTVVKNWVDIN